MNARSMSGTPLEAEKPLALTCDWKDCPIAARFHIEVPLQSSVNLVGDRGERRPFSRTHHNVCGAHMDEYSTIGRATAIYTAGKCPQCDPGERL